jgi:hypothetical protein
MAVVDVLNWKRDSFSVESLLTSYLVTLFMKNPALSILMNVDAIIRSRNDGSEMLILLHHPKMDTPVMQYFTSFR